MTGAPPPDEVAIPLLDLGIEAASDAAFYGGLINLARGEPGAVPDARALDMKQPKKLEQTSEASAKFSSVPNKRCSVQDRGAQARGAHARRNTLR